MTDTTTPPPPRSTAPFASVRTTAVVCLMVLTWVGCATIEGPLFDQDGDGYPMGTDCNDQDAATGPQYADQDGDGFGAGDPLDVCDLEAGGRSLVPGDCDDTDPASYPGAAEVCDTGPSGGDATPPYGIDNDCDGEIDEDVPYLTWYIDADGDGYGSDEETVVACAQPDGYSNEPGDCDDADAARHPAAVEVCNDQDDDCSGGDGDYYVSPTDPEAEGETGPIQAAINAAGEGCSIVVAPGTYYEQVDFQGKGVHLRSEKGPDVTILDGRDETALVVFDSGENDQSILEGFTLQNGAGMWIDVCCPPDQILYGGAILVYTTSPVIRNNVITKNYARVGGAIAVYGGAPRIEGNTFSQNTADTYGSALFLYDVHTSDVVGNVFENNTILGPAEMGQATVAIQLSSFVTVEDNTFADNQANMGAGVVALDTANLVVRGNRFERNAANLLSGALAVATNCTATIEGNTFVDNVAVAGGGAILLQGQDGLVRADIRDNTFDNNDGGDDGGAIYCMQDCVGEIVHNRFTGNRADQDGYGGAIDLWDATLTTDERLILTNNLFTGNVATYGGAISSWGAATTVTIANNTLSGNEASGAGAGLFMTEDTPDFQNNLVTFNGPANGLHFYGITGLQPDRLAYNDFYGNTGGEANVPGFTAQYGNISADPMYTDIEAGDFSLTSGSPAVDAGNPDEAYNDTDGSRNDMGCYGGPQGDW